MSYWSKVNNQLEEILSRHKGIRHMFRSGKLTHVELLVMSDIQLGLHAILLHQEFECIHSVRRLLDWVDLLNANDVMIGPVLDVLELGRAFCDLDRFHRKRKGWARSLLIQALQFHPMCEGRETYLRDLSPPIFEATTMPSASFLPKSELVFQL